MCHEGGERTYRRLLNLDIGGVWFTVALGPISSIYTGLYCHPNLRHYFLIWYLMVALVVLYYMLVESKRQRAMALTVQFVFLVLSHLFRLTPLASTNPEAFSYYIAMDIFSAIGALINAFHVPERWIPGKVDYVFNGHTLMHICAFVGLAVGRHAFVLDMLWLNNDATCDNE